ncbi:hypothetical protein N5079_08135 [Planotetraspora sp. A-T 1434]|uniref:hypothetical protein n=1 Tax=Planotetraspora sp. A-T 1434 TaxID=2979219 RepID=UPI0021BF1B43|nr:hypothetical protein [Planotetraspora sp. A-T 1434]MCT9930193.1 hypothetical protein [Planotetraspora sp. A-T 1434]
MPDAFHAVAQTVTALATQTLPTGRSTIATRPRHRPQAPTPLSVVTGAHAHGLTSAPRRRTGSALRVKHLRTHLTGDIQNGS